MLFLLSEFRIQGLTLLTFHHHDIPLLSCISSVVSSYQPYHFYSCLAMRNLSLLQKLAQKWLVTCPMSTKRHLSGTLLCCIHSQLLFLLSIHISAKIFSFQKSCLNQHSPPPPPPPHCACNFDFFVLHLELSLSRVYEYCALFLLLI